MSSDTHSRLAAALADRYAILRELGAGGMATVFLAHVLFNAAAYSILAISRHSFDVMPDDQHFLMMRRRGGAT